MCMGCDTLVSPGLYGHQQCVDGEQPSQVRDRIIYLMAKMPLVALRQLLLSAEYFSPEEANAELARQLVNKPVVAAVPARRIASRWSSKRGTLP